MSGHNHKWSEAYLLAIEKMNEHIERADDGTFILNVEDGSSIGINDPVVFADLRRSLDVTNKMIREGEVRPGDVA
jgi:hypothetical protein